jgi:NTP pyrophosphatase (non-canonical NTP hydrolase)
MDEKTLGQLGYEAYFDFFNGLGLTGNNLLTWQALDDRIKNAWEVSASKTWSYNKVIGNNFIDCFNDLQKELHETAISKGWWNKERNDGELIALMHSELSEALEGLRKGNPQDDRVIGFNNVEVEFADTIIRIMDMAQARGLRVAEAIIAKNKANKQREHMHGGKKF